jgi:hypothetical protein
MDSIARYDGALLAQLEERGSVELNEFVEYVRGVGDASGQVHPQTTSRASGFARQWTGASFDTTTRTMC